MPIRIAVAGVPGPDGCRARAATPRQSGRWRSRSDATVMAAPTPMAHNDGYADPIRPAWCAPSPPATQIVAGSDSTITSRDQVVDLRQRRAPSPGSALPPRAPRPPAADAVHPIGAQRKQQQADHHHRRAERLEHGVSPRARADHELGMIWPSRGPRATFAIQQRCRSRSGRPRAGSTPARTDADPDRRFGPSAFATRAEQRDRRTIARARSSGRAAPDRRPRPKPPAGAVIRVARA